jgi:hypothetical protein
VEPNPLMLVALAIWTLASLIVSLSLNEKTNFIRRTTLVAGGPFTFLGFLLFKKE